MEIKKFYVYEIKNTVNGKAYIGQTRHPKDRWLNHRIAAKRGDNILIYRAMREHGIHNFTFTLLEEYGTENESLAAEKSFIKTRGTFFPDGYNLTLGGKGALGLICSPETREKLRRAITGQKRSPETLEKMSKGRKGKPKSPEHRAKLSAALKGQIISPERCAAISKRRIAEEAAKKIKRDHPLQPPLP